jgi:hypothetical protein
MTGSVLINGSLTGPAIVGTVLGGTLSTAAQPNITSVGTLDKLIVTNAITASKIETTNGIGHLGDSDTEIGFTDDIIAFKAGGETFMTYTQNDSGADQFVLSSFLTTNITASGNISASGDISTSGNLIGTIDGGSF